MTNYLAIVAVIFIIALLAVFAVSVAAFVILRKKKK